MRKPGKIYILSNPAFKEGIYKIGMTTRTGRARAWELYHKASGVPDKFKVEYTLSCNDCELAEQIVHNKLAKFRVNEYREFFEIPLDQAKQVIDEVILEIHRPSARSLGKRSRVGWGILVWFLIVGFSTAIVLYSAGVSTDALLAKGKEILNMSLNAVLWIGKAIFAVIVLIITLGVNKGMRRTKRKVRKWTKWM